MKKVILTYGLLSGLASGALMLGMALYLSNDPSNFKGSEIIGFAGIILSLLLVFFGVRAYREQQEGGSFSFLRGFQVGILITVISCLCYVVAWMVIYPTMMPDFMEKYAAYSLAELQKSGASAETIAAQTQKMQEYQSMYKNPFVVAALTFTEPFPIGLLITLLSAAILRRK